MIIIIDSTDVRRDNLQSKLKETLPKDIKIKPIRNIWNVQGDLILNEELINEAIVFAHINNIIIDGKPYSQILNNLFKRSAYVILYSGGGIHFNGIKNGILNIYQADSQMHWDIQDYENSNIYIIKDSINNFNDLDRNSLIELIKHGIASETKDYIKVIRSKSELSQVSYIQLISLDILLQGYLAVKAPKFIFGGQEYSEKIVEEFITKNKLFENINNELNEIVPVSRLFRPSECEIKKSSLSEKPQSKNDDGWFWFDVLLSEVKQKSSDDMISIAPELFTKETATRLVWQIMRKECLDMDDGKLLKEVPFGGDDKKVIELFHKAHLELIEWLNLSKKKIRLDEFENERNAVNHNYFKNAFLVRIGNPRNIPYIERSAKLLAALNYKDSEKKQEHEEQYYKKEDVLGGFLEWKSTKEKIIEFLSTAPIRYALKTKSKYLDLIAKIYMNKDSSIEVIDNFIKNFDQLKGKDEIETKKEIEKLWIASDYISESLSNIKLTEKFSDYFDF